jgi:hypothetical protein
MRHHVFSTIIFFIFIFLNFEVIKAQSCNPASKSQCCAFVQQHDQAKVSRISTLDGNCSLNVVHQNSNRSFRRFGFGNDGQVSVILQPGGNSQRAMASQSFLIYPFGEKPTAEPPSGGRFAVNSGSGQRWVFDTQTALPVSLSNCRLTVSPTFSLTNSGVSIASCKNQLVIETPVETGGEYIAHADGMLTIRDPAGTTCRVRSSDIYRYITKGPNNTKDRANRYYNIQVKYRSNSEMAQQLRRLCPRLDVSMLTSRSAATRDSSVSPPPSPRPSFELDLSDLPPDPPTPVPSTGTQN